MAPEVWKPVVGFEGIYEVSDLGRVKSLWRSVRRSDGKPRMVREKILTPSARPDGYLVVNLGRNSTRRVHALVLEAFIGPRPAGNDACHNDGVRSNNQLDNLRWDTRSANNLDQVKHGTHPEASKSSCPQGHPYDGIGTRNKGQYRYCITCRRESAARNGGRR